MSRKVESFQKDYFYSRPCGRGDDFVVTTKQKGAISTHAPAGGATDSYAVSLNFVYPFLLTPLREGRLPQLDAAGEIGIISTHAPAGGATGKRRCFSS